LRVHDPPESGEQRGGQRVERLVGPHQIEVVVGHAPGNLEHLVEHPAMLSADAYPADEARVPRQGVDQRNQFDRFGAGAEDREDAPGHAPRPSALGLSARLRNHGAGRMSDGSTTTGTFGSVWRGATVPASSASSRSMYCLSSSSTRACVAAASESMVDMRSSRAASVSSPVRTSEPVA